MAIDLAAWPSELLTTSEVCAALDLHRVTISRAVKAGHIEPAKRVGAGRHSAYVFTLDEVRRYADSRRRS